MKKILLAVITVYFTSFSSQIACASLITLLSDFPTQNKIVNFEQFSGSNIFGPGPIQVGQSVGEDITWFANNHGSLLFGDPLNFYRFASNGDWKNGKTFAGVNAQPDNEIYSMRFDFNGGPVNFVGGFINYTPSITPGDFIRFPEARLTVLDNLNNILETYDLKDTAPISTLNQINGGEHRGIKRLNNDIYAFELLNSGIAIDDLTFSRIGTNAIPEPSTIILFGVGLLGGLRLKRKWDTVGGLSCQ